MLIVSFPAQALATNCYVIAREQGASCVIVDPGIGITQALSDVLTSLSLKPAAVLLTHGHLDHTFSAAHVCGSDVPTYIHADDRYRLANPYDQLSSELRTLVEENFGDASTWHEPQRVVTFTDGSTLTLAGVNFTVTHAPGHTEGSSLLTILELPEGIDTSGGLDRTILTGDVLFAGSVGRTDLPGGDAATMRATLRERVLALPDSALILPGHGPASTMAHERATNPFLQGLTNE